MRGECKLSADNALKHILQDDSQLLYQVTPADVSRIKDIRQSLIQSAQILTACG